MSAMRLFPTRWLRAPVGITSLLGSGFAVRRDLDSPDGPIPLVVSGETGVFVVELRFGADLDRLARQAQWLGDQLDAWVTPVACVDGAEPHNIGRVSVVSHDHLAAWLLALPRKPATPKRFSVDVAA